MAVNASRSMNASLEQGLIDGRYMQLNPGWENAANPSVDRLSWPTYRQVEQHKESTMLAERDCGCDHGAVDR